MDQGMRNVAVLDLGTNTFNLQIWTQSETGDNILHSEKRVVKLAEGSKNMSKIQPEAYQRALDAIDAYKVIINAFEVEKIVAFATSGVRSASNGFNLISDIKTRAEIDVITIDGKREAELIYKGVAFGLSHIIDKNSIIIDIGGGSTEYILVIDGQLFWSGSFKLGASRIQEKFNLLDPLSPENINEVKTFIEESTFSLRDQLKALRIEQIIGCSGSFDTIADVIFSKEYEIDQTPNGSLIPIEAYQNFSKNMFRLNLQERLALKGMIPLRADLMPISCILINHLLELTQASKIYLSKYALKEGAYSELAQNLKLS